MQITIDTTEELSAQDLQILAILTGGTATPKPAGTKKTAVAAPTPEPEAEEDLVGGAPTMADAVAIATKLVSAGNAAAVKAALAEAGAARVSELAEDKIAGFVATLSG